VALNLGQVRKVLFSFLKLKFVTFAFSQFSVIGKQISKKSKISSIA
jgi:hypothetical protein